MAECRTCRQPVVFMKTRGTGKVIPVDAGIASDTIVRPRANLSAADLRLTGRSVQGRFGLMNEAMQTEPGEGTYRRHRCNRS